MLPYNLSSRLLALFALSHGSLASAACSGASASNVVDAVGDVVDAAVACNAKTLGGADQLAGFAASSCNAEQATYAALNVPVLLAAGGRCFCKETYYDTLGPGSTLGDVDLWTTCVGPWNTLFVHASDIVNDYVNNHGSQLFSNCNVCSDTQFTPIVSTLEQVEAVLDFDLDWRKQLLNQDVEQLKEGIQALVTATLFNGGVPNGKSSPTANFVISTITKGYGSSNNPQSRRGIANSIQLRQAAGNSSDPGLQFISDIIGVEVKAVMVPVNGTAALLTDQLKAAFSNSTFKDSLAPWNANLTSANYSDVQGDPFNVTNTTSTTSTPSGTATSTAASASKTNGSSSRPRSESSWVITALLFIAFAMSI